MKKEKSAPVLDDLPNRAGRRETHGTEIQPGNLPPNGLLVLMPQRFQQFFAFVLSDFAAAFFSEVAHLFLSSVEKLFGLNF